MSGFILVIRKLMDSFPWLGSGWVNSGDWEVSGLIPVIVMWVGLFPWLGLVGGLFHVFGKCVGSFRCLVSCWVHSSDWEVRRVIPVIRKWMGYFKRLESEWCNSRSECAYSSHLDWDVSGCIPVTGKKNGVIPFVWKWLGSFQWLGSARVHSCDLEVDGFIPVFGK